MSRIRALVSFIKQCKTIEQKMCVYFGTMM